MNTNNKNQIENLEKYIKLFISNKKKNCKDIFKELNIDDKHCKIITEIRDGIDIKNITSVILKQYKGEYKILFVILGNMNKDIGDLKATNKYERIALNFCFKKKKNKIDDVKIMYELLSAEVLEKIKSIGLLLSCFVISKKQKVKDKEEKLKMKNLKMKKIKK